MNREEAIKEWIVPAISRTWNDERCKEILEALEQEPCDDAVSREAVLDLCDSKDKEYKVRHFREDVECLPSVQPKQRTRRWIANGETFRCSECGELACCQGRYCNECGVKMEEVEEWQSRNLS